MRHDPNHKILASQANWQEATQHEVVALCYMLVGGIGITRLLPAAAVGGSQKLPLLGVAGDRWPWLATLAN